MDPNKHLNFLKDNILESSHGHHLHLGDLIRLSLRVFRVRLTRTILTILGASVGVGTVFFLVSLGFGLQFILVGQLATTEDSLITLEAFYPPESGLTISHQDIDKIINLEGSEEISPVAEFSGEAEGESNSGFLLTRIVRSNYFRLSGLNVGIGSSFTEGEKSIVVSSAALKLFGLDPDENVLGKEFSVKAFYQEGGRPDVTISETIHKLNLKGIITDDLQPPFVIVPFEMLKESPPNFQQVLVKAKDIEQVEPLKNKLIENGFLVSARLDLVNQARRIINIVTVILGIFGVAALLVSAIGMFNTMIIGFLERTFEVGIMKSIGATANDVRRLFLMESLIMGLLGGTGGILIGFLAGGVSNLVLNLLAVRLGGDPINLFIYPPQFVILIIVLSGFVGILSGVWPARRAARLSPKQAFLKK
jgi:putative ABC transport system permease protein